MIDLVLGFSRLRAMISSESVLRPRKRLSKLSIVGGRMKIEMASGILFYLGRFLVGRSPAECSPLNLGHPKQVVAMCCSNFL